MWDCEGGWWKSGWGGVRLWGGGCRLCCLRRGDETAESCDCRGAWGKWFCEAEAVGLCGERWAMKLCTTSTGDYSTHCDAGCFNAMEFIFISDIF